MFDSQTLIIYAAVTSSFLLGCVFSLIRNLSHQGKTATHTKYNVRNLLDRWDEQRERVNRLENAFECLSETVQTTAQAVEERSTSAKTPSRAKPASRAKSTSRSKSASRAKAPSRTKGASSGKAPRSADPCKLARSGADVESLMTQCKLSRAEAELVVSVHGEESKAA